MTAIIIFCFVIVLYLFVGICFAIAGEILYKKGIVLNGPNKLEWTGFWPIIISIYAGEFFIKLLESLIDGCVSRIIKFFESSNPEEK